MLAYVSTAEIIRRRQHVHVKLGYHHLYATCGKGINGGLIFIQIRIIDSVVRLHSYTVYTATICLQLSHYFTNSSTFPWACHRKIVNVKLGIGVSFMGEFKCQPDIIRPYYLIIRRLPHSPVIINGLINNIPTLYFTLIS